MTTEEYSEDYIKKIDAVFDELSPKLEAVAPIMSFGVNDPDDKAAWMVEFAPEATPDQRAAAQTLIDQFDFLSVYKKASLVSITPDEALTAAIMQAKSIEQVDGILARFRKLSE